MRRSRAIRGVGVDGVMRTLQQRGYVDETGRDPGPGQASLFGTTDVFLERLGLNSLDELPSLGDFVPGADVVELLEHGLRVESDQAESAPVDEAPGGDEPAADEPEGDRPEADRTADDGVTVDITDPVPLDLDAEDD